MERSAVYPPHPEEGASTCASRRRNHRVAPVSKDGAATDLGFTRNRHQYAQVGYTRLAMFETPCTRLRNLGRSKIAAPHHEGREEPRVRQIDRNPLLGGAGACLEILVM